MIHIRAIQPTDRAATLLDPVLRPLWAAYGALKKARERRQPLELDLPERREDAAALWARGPRCCLA